MIATVLLGFAAVFKVDMAKAVNPAADFDGDGQVDIGEAILMSNAFGTTNASLNWNATYDLNNDGVINILDMIILASYFG
jgi:hypothetical protein